MIHGRRLRAPHRARAQHSPTRSGPGTLGPFTHQGLPLVVPPAEEAAARGRGAVFDPGSGWTVPAGEQVPVHRFQRWLDPATVVVDYGPTTSARIVAIPYACYRCGVVSRPIAGVLVGRGLSFDPEGLVPFDDVGELLAVGLDDATLARFGIGTLRWRRSRPVPDGYLANGCRQCSTIFGNWHLGEELLVYRAGGGDLARLTVDLVVQLPVAVLEYEMGR
jgi:hypothetical protein